MKEAIFDKFFELRHKEDEVQIALKSIEETKQPLQEKLTNIQMELADVQNSILEAMEKENVKTYTYGINNVTAAIRRTLGIVDEEKVMNFITSKTSKIGKTVGIPVKDIKAKSFLKILNKPFVKEIADSWLKVEGSPMQGTELRETKYLTVK